MNTYIIIGIGLGILLFLIFKRSIFRKDSNSDVKRIVDSNALMNNEKMKSVVNEFIKRGKKIEAIKYIHKSGNVSLSDAKDFVEKIELMRRSGSNELFDNKNENVYGDTESNDNSMLNAKVKALITSGNKIAAIKLVVEEQKKGLAEAKDYVEKIESEIKNFRI